MDRRYSIKVDDMKAGMLFYMHEDGSEVEYKLEEMTETPDHMLKLYCTHTKTGLPTVLDCNPLYPFDAFVATLNY